MADSYFAALLLVLLATLAASNTTCANETCNHHGNATYNATMGNCKCACAAGFAGTWCQNNTCTYATCNNNGFPNLNPTTGQCTCACYAGYVGTHCETNSCTYATCNYNGYPMYNASTNSCRCSCFAGYTGSLCQTSTFSRAPNMTSNGSTFAPNGTSVPRATESPGLPTCELALSSPSYADECTQCVSFANTSEYQQIVQNGVVQCPPQPQQAQCDHGQHWPPLLVPFLVASTICLLLALAVVILACKLHRVNRSKGKRSALSPYVEGISLGKLEEEDDAKHVVDGEKVVEEFSGYNVCGGQPSRTYNVRDPNGGFSHNPYPGVRPNPSVRVAPPVRKKATQPNLVCHCHPVKPNDWLSLTQHLNGPGHAATDGGVVLQCRECNWAILTESSLVVPHAEAGHVSLTGVPCAGLKFATWPSDVLYVTPTTPLDDPAAPGAACPEAHA